MSIFYPQLYKPKMLLQKENHPQIFGSEAGCQMGRDYGETHVTDSGNDFLDNLSCFPVVV